MKKYIVRAFITIQPLIYFTLRGWEFETGDKLATTYILMLVCFIMSMLITNSED